MVILKKFQKNTKMRWRMVNLSIFFWWKMEKTCSIMVSKVKSQSMAGRGDFSKMWFFFPQGILTFFYSCFYAGGKMLIFLDVNVLISKGRPRNNDLWNWFSVDLGVQMIWYLDWGSFRAWKRFSKIWSTGVDLILILMPL